MISQSAITHGEGYRNRLIRNYGEYAIKGVSKK